MHVLGSAKFQAERAAYVPQRRRWRQSMALPSASTWAMHSPEHLQSIHKFVVAYQADLERFLKTRQLPSTAKSSSAPVVKQFKPKPKRKVKRRVVKSESSKVNKQDDEETPEQLAESRRRLREARAAMSKPSMP